MDSETIHRYFTGEATEEEQDKILEWLDKDPAGHVAELNEHQYLDLAVQVYGEAFVQGGCGDGRAGRRRGRLLSCLLSAAAAFAVLVGVWFASDSFSAYRNSKRLLGLEAPAGERLHVTLEDGTRVSLNAASRLEYPALFARGERRVKLEGEALFEVRHDGDRPFVVETFASEVEVLGTRFSVDADAEHARFSATLLDGSVVVRSLFAPAQTITMQPYERVSLVGGELCKERVEDFRELLWTEGIVYFSQMPFDELMRRLERSYNVRIVIEKDTLPQLHVRNGKVRISDGIEYAMHVLQQVADFAYSYDQEKNLIVIR